MKSDLRNRPNKNLSNLWPDEMPPSDHKFDKRPGPSLLDENGPKGDIDSPIYSEISTSFQWNRAELISCDGAI